MKPLTDLISEVQNVEEKAHRYANMFVAIPRKELNSWQLEKAEDFRAGAKSQSPIADALRVALEYVPPLGIGAERIQAILEGKE